MGFLKTECSECHAEVGLNRFRLSDGWLCPDCMKKLKPGFGLGRSLAEVRARAAEAAAKQDAKQCIECREAVGSAETSLGWVCRGCLQKLGFSIWKGPSGLKEVEEKLLAKRAAAVTSRPHEAQPLDALGKLQFRKFISDQSGLALAEVDAYVAALPEPERDELISAFQAQSRTGPPQPAPVAAPPVGAQTAPGPAQPQCPKCASYQTTFDKQGFSAGKAIAGVLLAPGGVLWGLHGRNKIVLTCLKCGHQWKPG